ncbi:MAG: hypothetical protein SH868_11850 [Bythopirellula sp.]|nr:hypothetical protein [Bythopirellula sp.]
MTVADELLLLLQFASSLFMTGLIWFVQLVHYPLMKFADAQQFSSFCQAHQNRTTWVVAGPMFLELGTALWLFASSPLMRQSLAYQGALVLLIVIWISTIVRQMPLHQKLLRGYDAECIECLVRSNWMRTMAWTVRSIVLGWLMLSSLVFEQPNTQVLGC